MPTDADGTWQRPIVLACPRHQPSWAVSAIQEHLDPGKVFGCWHAEHGSPIHLHRWAVCNAPAAAGGPGWCDLTDPDARHHAWRQPA